MKMAKLVVLLVGMLSLVACGGGSGGSDGKSNDPSAPAVTRHKVVIYPGDKVEVTSAVEGDKIVNLVLNGDGVSKIAKTTATNLYFNYNCGWHAAGGAALSANYSTTVTTTITGIPSSARFLLSIMSTDGKEYTLNPDYTDVVLSSGLVVNFNKTLGVYEYGANPDQTVCGGVIPPGPLPEIKHSIAIYSGNMGVTLATDGDYVIHLVKNGQIISVKKSDIAYIYWSGDVAGWYPNKGIRANVVFPATTIQGTPAHDEGIWGVALKDGTLCSLNIDWVALSGLASARTDRNLIKY